MYVDWKKNFFFFKWGYNCFTMLCWFLLCNHVYQLNVYMPPLPLEPPSHTSRSSQSTKLTPCAPSTILQIPFLFMAEYYLFHCIYIPHLYLFIWQWAFRLLIEVLCKVIRSAQDREAAEIINTGCGLGAKKLGEVRNWVLKVGALRAGSLVRGAAPVVWDSEVQPGLFSFRSSFLIQSCHESRVSTCQGVHPVSWLFPSSSCTGHMLIWVNCIPTGKGMHFPQKEKLLLSWGMDEYQKEIKG